MGHLVSFHCCVEMTRREFDKKENAAQNGRNLTSEEPYKGNVVFRWCSEKDEEELRRFERVLDGDSCRT